MEITILSPYYAFLLLALPVLWFLLRKSNLSRLHVAIRSLLLAFVLLALTQPVFLQDTDATYQMVIVDQSDSLTEAMKTEALTQAEKLINRASENDKVVLVQLGGDKLTIDQDIVHLSNLSQTSLSQALEVAIAEIPLGANASVTLISDGLSTDRHWGKTYAQLKARKIPVNTYQLESKNDLFIAAVKASETRVGEDLTLYVDVVGSGSNLSLSVSDVNGQQLAQSGVFDSVERTQVAVTFAAEQAGAQTFVAKLDASGITSDDPSNNSKRALVAVQPSLDVLYLGERQQGAVPKLQALLGKGFNVTSESVAELDNNFDFSQHDVVLLDDLPLVLMSDQVQNNLINAVKNQGVGLLHSGGEAAFAAGGYYQTPMAELLPVEMEQSEQKTDPSVGLAIILDTSGSMAGKRIDLARHIARVAVRKLKPHDRVGIVEFYGAKQWSIPMQPATNKIEIERAIGRMKAIGGTVLFPAIQEAYFGIKDLNTKHKHILVITDAGIEENNYEGMLRRLAEDNINVSTILVGPGGHNQIMANMANWGKGRFYSVPNEFNLVEMILKQPSTKKMPAYKRGRYQMTGQFGQGWWADIDTERLPALNGYVKVTARDGAESVLLEKQSETPIVSSWQYGLGRVTAFMSEPLGHGTLGWQRWPEYGQWLGRVVAKTAVIGSRFDADVERHGDQIRLVVQRTNTDLSLVPEITLLDEQGQTTAQNIVLDEKAPGLYVSNFTWPHQQDLAMLVKSGGQGRMYVTDIATSDVSQELQVDPATKLDLAKLTELTNGQQLTTDNIDSVVLSSSLGEYSFVVTKLWPYLLLLALIAYLLDLVVRRWPSARRA